MKMLSQKCQLPYLIASTSISFIRLIFIKYDWFISMGIGAIKLEVGKGGYFLS